MKRIKCLILIIMLAILMPCIAVIKVDASVQYHSNQTYVVETDVNDPMTIEELVEYIDLQAFDDGLDISDSIVNVNSYDYLNHVLYRPTPASRDLGEFMVEFKAIDNSGNESIMDLVVNVIDTEAPTIYPSLTETNRTFCLQEVDDNINNTIIKGVKAIDNHDLMDVTYEVIESDLIRKAGEYTVTVRISDKSNNYTDLDINVEIVNTILPYFSATSSYMLVSPSDHMNPLEVINELEIKAYSADGTLLTLQYDIPNSTGFTTPGIHQFELYAVEGNKTSTFTVYIEVFDETHPTFTLDETVLVTDTSHLYTVDQFTSAIRLKAGRSDFFYDVIVDEYSLNFDKVGEYKYTVNVNYEDNTKEEMCFVMKVIESDTEEMEEEKVENTIPVYEKIWAITKKIGQILFGIVKWPINKIASIF